jgi:hypothetical protein
MQGEIQEYRGEISSTTSLVLDSNAMDRIMSMAAVMSQGVATVPKHLQGNQSDCMAVIMQAMQWRMSPFVVAQKTHVSQSGVLGYEAQLISAVATASGALATQPEFEFMGDWKKILGRVNEKTSEKGGKYYVAGWNAQDEIGLGVVCRATLRGESAPREITVLLSQCFPRFSTQWATDPQQQITYAAVRKFCRRYAPGAILGVYTPDELEQTDSDPVPPLAAGRQEIEMYSEKQFTKNLPAWKKLIESGKKSPEQIIATVGAKAMLTEEQKIEIMGLTEAPSETVNAETGEVGEQA